MRDQTFSKRLIKCWAVIAGKEYDIVQISSEFSLNSIPVATVTMALGRDVESIGTSSRGQASNINEKFLFRNPMQVYATSIIQDESPDIAAYDASVPSFEGKLIFDGYIAGFGFQRTASSAVLTVSVEHWLADLTASTMLSSSTHYGTPADLMRSALYKQAETSGNTSQGQPAIAMSSWISSFTDSGSIINDLWEGGIKKIFEKASSADNLADLNNQVGNCSSTDANNLNNAAKDAIPRITSKNAPLTIKLGSADSTDVAKNISSDLTSIFLENLAGQTMWDCLIACSGNYMFAIAPGINITQVVPYCPTVSTDPAFKSIKASQIESISISGDCPRMLRGVALVFPQTIMPLIDNTPPPPPDAKVVASYLNTSSGCKGVVLFKHTPSWMGTDFSYFTGDYKLGDPPSTVKPPEAGVPPDGKSPTVAADNLKGIKEAYAKALYGMEVIKGRQGTISGPLRFDIGVGSLIEFELPEDQHTTSTADNRYFYGVVVRLSFVIDANSAVASTTYTVAHIRTLAEEYDNGFISKDGHPIYENSWFGGALDEKL